MAKYIPPHLRNKVVEPEKISVKEILELPCPDRCKEWITDGSTVCLHHKFNKHSQTLQLGEYFGKSEIFLKWLKIKKQTGQGHPMINKCFQRKQHNEQKQDQRFGARYSSVQDSVATLYNRFLRYAADIDNGTDYVAKAKIVVNQSGEFCFLDLGFAPGGMVALLLDADIRIRGIGVNLAPDRGGNVYPLFLDDINESETIQMAMQRQNASLETKMETLSVNSGQKRFNSIEIDVIELARSNMDLLDLPDFKTAGGLDLCIVGITTSGSNQENEMDELELKNLLHFAQLLLGLKFLKNGGQMLVRLHLGLRLVDIHILVLLLECFQNHVVTKPLSEFAMRKTVWLHCDGYTRNLDAIARLERLLDPNLPAPYAESTKVDPITGENELNNPTLVTLTIDEILKKYGDSIINLLEPMWDAQHSILQFVMQGKSDRLCNDCRRGKSNCQRCLKSAPLSILEATRRVNERLKLTNEDLIM